MIDKKELIKIINNMGFGAYGELLHLYNRVYTPITEVKELLLDSGAFYDTDTNIYYLTPEQCGLSNSNPDDVAKMLECFKDDMECSSVFMRDMLVGGSWVTLTKGWVLTRYLIHIGFDTEKGYFWDSIRVRVPKPQPTTEQRITAMEHSITAIEQKLQEISESAKPKKRVTQFIDGAWYLINGSYPAMYCSNNDTFLEDCGDEWEYDGRGRYYLRFSYATSIKPVGDELL